MPKDYNKALEYEIFTNKEYAFADHVIWQAKIIFDIGGHIGLFSKYCHQINPGCAIHYFEPIPQLYQEAQQAIKNQNILMNNIGIAAKTGSSQLYFNSTKTMQSSAFPGTFLNPSGTPMTVQMKNLEEYVQDHKIFSIDLLKLDVEGMEYEIIASLSDGFFPKIQALLLEYHLLDASFQPDFDQMESKLSNYFVLTKFPHAYDRRLGYLLCQRK